MSLNEWIETELAMDGLRLAEPFEPGATLEPTSAGSVYAVPMPMDPATRRAALAWEMAATEAKRAALFGEAPITDETHVITPTMLADIWQTGGRRAAGALLRRMDEPTRARAEVGYWNMLRQQGHDVELIVVRVMFELALAC